VSGRHKKSVLQELFNFFSREVIASIQLFLVRIPPLAIHCAKHILVRRFDFKRAYAFGNKLLRIGMARRILIILSAQIQLNCHNVIVNFLKEIFTTICKNSSKHIHFSAMIS
jgi:hypothetical protein